MPNDVAIARVICPYFMRFSRTGVKEIICEGMAEDVESGVIFKSQQQMDAWTARWCNTYGYNNCPVAAAIRAKK